MESAFRALLVNDTAVSALVGSRIYWNGFEQAVTNPAIALYKISGAPEYTSQAPDNLEESRVQLDIRALTFGSAISIANAIKTKLSGFSGIQGNIEFQSVFLLSERQKRDKLNTTQYHHFSFDFAVWHKPA